MRIKVLKLKKLVWELKSARSVVGSTMEKSASYEHVFAVGKRYSKAILYIENLIDNAEVELDETNTAFDGLEISIGDR